MMNRAMALTATVTGLILLAGCATGRPRLEMQATAGEESSLRWVAPARTAVRLPAPAMTVKLGEREVRVPLRLQSHELRLNGAVFQYEILGGAGAETVSGRYKVEAELLESGRVLRQQSALALDKELKHDLTVTTAFEVTGKPAAAMVTEAMELIQDPDAPMPDTALYTHGARAQALEAGRPASAWFAMGLSSTDQAGARLSMPVVGFAFLPAAAGTPPWMLAVSSDPHSGTQFHSVRSGGATQIRLVNRYAGATVPLKEERRTAVLEFHRQGADGNFMSFYRTIPEVAPAPGWVREVALAYYDYNGDDGQGWYRDIEAMARRCPPEHRGKIVACLHGWYDNLGRYCYDHASGTLQENWQAFANPRGRSKPAIPMSKAEMHRRIQFAKERGFRVILYFADSTNCTGAPAMGPGQTFVQPNGQTRAGWAGPCGGGGPLQDPSSLVVQEWYLGYLEALLKEYGRVVDGFVYDESNLFPVNDVSYRIRERPAYADRAMLGLVKALTLKVQGWRAVNPALVLMEGSHYFYGLVANGSFTDFPGLPLVANYRNASWTCSWTEPGIRNVHTHFRTRPDIQYPYGLDMGLTNGEGTDTGPAEMKPEILDAVFQHFLKRVQEGPERPKIKTIQGLEACLAKQ